MPNKIYVIVIALSMAVLISMPALAHVSGAHDFGVLGFFHFFTSIEHVIWIAPLLILLVLKIVRRTVINYSAICQSTGVQQDDVTG